MSSQERLRSLKSRRARIEAAIAALEPLARKQPALAAASAPPLKTRANRPAADRKILSFPFESRGTTPATRAGSVHRADGRHLAL